MIYVNQKNINYIDILQIFMYLLVLFDKIQSGIGKNDGCPIDTAILISAFKCKSIQFKSNTATAPLFTYMKLFKTELTQSPTRNGYCVSFHQLKWNMTLNMIMTHSKTLNELIYDNVISQVEKYFTDEQLNLWLVWYKALDPKAFKALVSIEQASNFAKANWKILIKHFKSNKKGRNN